MSVLVKNPAIKLSEASHKYESMDASSNCSNQKKGDLLENADLINQVQLQLKSIKSSIKQGVHTPSYMFGGGFKYTGNGDTARCEHCGLEVSNWTSDMKPLTVHAEKSPNCSFIHSVRSTLLSNIPLPASSSTTSVRNTSISKEPEKPSKRQKTEPMDSQSQSNTLLETDLLQQVRRRTFSHWPHRTIPSATQMVEAGFFNCNVGDRVICIYCNLICQQWTPHTDDPCKIHKTLSPNCPFVKMKLIAPAASSTIIVNESPTSAASSNHSLTSNHLDPLRSNEIVHTAACNPAYTEIPKRHASFVTWPAENLPSVEDLVRAGFFYTGTKTIVTCFYCKGSLQNWGPNDNPMIEHARWFPQCAYAKQLCGDNLYRKIQESKRAQQERARANDLRDQAASGILPSTNSTANSRRLLIPDESTLSRLVAARLDLPISQRLLDQNVKLSIIKRCWEDQLRLKQDDFVSECDLFIACLIRQKQIEHSGGKKENIVIPRIKMKQIREQAEKERNGTCSTEVRNKTIEREKSFRLWPYSSPSRMNMFAAGWLFNSTKAADYTACPYCGVSYHNWQPEDNPWLIHRRLRPSCPFLLSPHPMHSSSVSIKRSQDVFTPEKIGHKTVRTMSDVIITSVLPYGVPPDRHESFSSFPGGPPENIDALCQSGFYYEPRNKNIRCYNCLGVTNDFHECPPNEINTLHLTKFPECHFPQLLLQQGEARPTNNDNLCEWCLVNLKVLAIDPCEHLAVCELCAQVINTCPRCGIVPETFVTPHV